MKHRYFLVAAFLSLAGMIVTAEPTTKPAATPVDAVANLFEALIRNDDASAIASLVPGEENRKMEASLNRMMQAAEAFRKDFIATFGDKAWDDFNSDVHDPNPPGRKSTSNAKLIIPSVKEMEELRKSAWEEDAGVTYVDQPGISGPPVKVVKLDGKWQVDLASILPEGSKADDFVKSTNGFAAAVELHRRAIGRPGISADDIDVELGRDMMKAIGFFKSDEPHLYDVEKFLAPTTTQPAAKL